jgi:hypothetical protein
MDEELCACFVDWEMAFGCVNWTKLMQILKGSGISRLYVNQSTKLRLDQGETRSVKIRREVQNAVCHHFYSICATNTLQRKLLKSLET